MTDSLKDAARRAAVRDRMADELWEVALKREEMMDCYQFGRIPERARDVPEVGAEEVRQRRRCRRDRA